MSHAMRQGAFIAACAAATLFIVTSGRAQVVINQQALEQLGGKPVRKAPVHRGRHRATAQHVPSALGRHMAWAHELPLPPPLAPRPEAAKARLPRPPSIPPAPPKPKPKPKPEARSIVLRFAGKSDVLDNSSAGELQTFMAAKMPKGARFFVRATAPGNPDDPSIARRLSLARGMKVRNVLHRTGIPPQQIIVQALGNPPGMPDDRVTLTELP